MAPSVTGWRWRAGALTVVIVPIVVACWRALLSGWEPIGDNGILVVRAQDVFTSHNPLLGSWTSASIASGQAVNNPGPLYLDLIALPVKLLGHSVGLAVGVALVNVAAVTFVILVSERLAGRTAMLSLTVVAALLEWSLGSELLFDVWQPNALVLPGLAFMVAAWGVACGRPWFLPWSLGVGSLLVQTHLSYVYLVPIAMLGAIASAAATRSIGAGLRRPLVTTAAVGVAAWAQPIIEHFTSSGPGNFSSLIEASRQSADRIGPRLGVRLLAEVVATPPFVGRSSYTDAIPAARVVGSGDNVPVIAFTGAVLAVTVLVAALVANVWWHRRRGKVEIAALGTTVLILLAGCIVSLTLMPVGVIGLASHQMRWLWPVGALVTVTLLSAAITAASAILQCRSDAADLMLIAAATVVAVLSLPTHVSASGPTASRDSLPTAQQLGGQLDALEGRGTVLFDTSTLAFGEPYSGYTFAALADRRIPFVFENEVDVRQFGEGRRYRGDADLRIWLAQGLSALDEPLPQGVERVAFVRGLDGDETEEMLRLENRLRDEARQTGLTLNGAGREAVRAGRLPATALEPDPGQHPFEAIGALNLAVEEGWIELTAEQSADYERFVELGNRRFFGTIALLAAPVDIRPSD